MSSCKRVLVWRLDVLPGSETFVRNHVLSLPTWSATLAGVRLVESSLSAPNDIVVFGSSRLERALRRGFTSLLLSRRVKRLIVLGKFDVVHAHFAFDGASISRFCRRAKIPLIVTVHGTDVTAASQRAGLLGMVYRRRIRRGFLYAHTVLAVSPTIAARAVELGAPKERVQIINLGVDLSSDRRRRERHQGVDSPDIIFVGRLVEKKGLSDLIKALSQCASSWRLLVVGDGPLRSQLEEEAQGLGVDVRFTGLLTAPEVLDAMARSRLLCVPSKTARDGDMEGFPTVVMEAAAIGLPVIASDHSGLGDRFEGGFSGPTYSEGNVAGLAALLDEMLRSQDVLEQYGKMQKNFAAEHYDVKNTARKLEKIYDFAQLSRLS